MEEDFLEIDIDNEIDDSDIVITGSRIIEFELEEGLNLCYDLDHSYWYTESVSLETGIEYSEELDLSDFPIRLDNNYILQLDEFKTYQSIVSEEITLWQKL